MNFILTLIILIIVLGLIVFIHELGHFLAAKSIKAYIHEFAVGMGPTIFSFKRKNDETKYSLRLLPLGGYNAFAAPGEKGIKKDRILDNKKYSQRLFVLIMGIIFNFILAIILLFINGLIFGSPITKPYIGNVVKNSASYNAGLREDDLIISINGKKVNSFDDVLLETRFSDDVKTYQFLIERNEEEMLITVVPTYEEDEEGNSRPVFGFASSTKRENGIINAFKYAVTATYKNITSVFNILGKLITGKIGMNNLSGPIGVFSVIDNIKSRGLESLIYLTAYLSINVGVINLLPIPVFDGGKILLLLIERIKKDRLNPKIETTLNMIGYILLMILIIYVTFNDILNLF